MAGMVAEMKGRNLWDEIFKLRDQQREDLKKSVWLIKGNQLPWENNKQGIMKWYMHPFVKSPCINTLAIFVQQIPPGSRSGRLQHPGNQVIFVWEGQGYTILDGQRYHWSKNDVVQLPLRREGRDRPARQYRSRTTARVLICCEPNAFQSTWVIAAAASNNSKFPRLPGCRRPNSPCLTGDEVGICMATMQDILRCR